MILTKIKLINWYFFSNETITLKGNTLLSGENGTGKSTLVDAIYYVLSAGDTRNFNHAANQNAKRTLETYMRCKTGNENKAYLRNDSEIITHIALEYENEKGRDPFTFGVVLELSQGNSSPSVHFYYAGDYRIKEEDYIKDGIIQNHRELSKRIPSYDSWDKYTVSQRRTNLARDVFKLDSPEKYYDLLSKAIAFKPIEEVNSFVNDFLLKDKKLDLDTLKSDMRNYNDIHKLVVREEAKLHQMSSFIPNAEKYEANLKLIHKLDLLKIKLKEEDAQFDMEKYQGEQNKVLIEADQNKRRLLSLDETITNLTREISSYENNEAYQALHEKENVLKRKNDDLNRVNEDIFRHDAYLEAEEQIRKASDIRSSFYSDYKAQDYPAFSMHIREYKKTLDAKQNELHQSLAEMGIESRSLDSKIKENRSSYERVKKGIRDYDQRLKALIDAIKEGIYTSRRKSVDVTPFCEFLEIKPGEEKWQNALEGYLNTQRFDLIIDPAYYLDALRIYENVKDKLGIYGFGIVDVKKIDEDSDKEGSLYEKLSISNKYAKKYARLLLNNVMCCNDVAELNKHKTSVTASGMVYKNYCTRAISRAIWEKPFIGRDSLRRQQEILENEYKELDQKQKKLLKNEENLNAVLKKISSSKADRLSEMKDYWSEAKLLTKDVSRLTAEIESDRRSETLVSLDAKLQRARAQEQDAKREQRNLNARCDELSRILGNLGKGIEDSKKIMDEAHAEFEGKLVFEREDSASYMDFINTMNAYTYQGHLNKTRILSDSFSAQQGNTSMKSGIERGMSDYAKDFNPDLVSGIDSIPDFINEYYRVKNFDVVKYQQKAKESYEACNKGFRKYFLAGIRTNILEAKNEIAKLNKNLKQHRFGMNDEVYEFILSPAKDLGEYYRIITSGEEWELKDIFTETLNDADQKMLEELFAKVASDDGSEESEKYLQKYMDYRSYMNYDIRVTDKDGNSYLVSRTSREKSGGETQTPFYVVIAACFDELMRHDGRNAESCCMVIFDEAFNNMDEGRIEEVLQYFRKLSIQLFIVVPGVRTYSISPYMDSVIGIARAGNRAVLFHEAGK